MRNWTELNTSAKASRISTAVDVFLSTDENREIPTRDLAGMVAQALGVSSSVVSPVLAKMARGGDGRAVWTGATFIQYGRRCKRYVWRRPGPKRDTPADYAEFREWKEAQATRKAAEARAAEFEAKAQDDEWTIRPGE